MSRDMLQFEERFLEGLQEVHLPMTLNVIYQEGIRGNHILFDETDLTRFDQMRMDSRCLPTTRNSEEVEENFYKMLMMTSFTEIRDFIQTCEFNMRRQLFLMYRRFLNHWSNYLKNSLN